MVKTSTPRNNALGTDDQSAKIAPPMEKSSPQFIPLIYFRGEKGRTEKTQVNFAKALNLYGEKTFDISSKFYNYSTVFMEGIFSKAGIIEAVRLTDPNIVVKSNATVWVDIALDDLPEYERDHLGNYILDASGEPNTKDTTIEGYRYKIYLSHVDNETYDTTREGNDIYKAEISDGFMTDKNGESSTMYPILTFIGSSLGEALDMEGFTIEPLVGSNTDDSIIENNRVLPYIFRRYSKYTGEKRPLEHFYGSNSVVFSLHEKEVNKTTNVPMNLEYFVPNYWENNEDNLKSDTDPMLYSDFDEPIVYYEFVKELTNILFTKEAPYITTAIQTWDDDEEAATAEWFTEFRAGSDSAEVGQDQLFNILTGVGVELKHYFTFVHSDAVVNDDSVEDTTISDSVVLYLDGGGDGEIYDDATFNVLVRTKLADYKNGNHKVNTVALNPESVFIDTGYEQDTKLDASNILSFRRDVVPLISTHAHDEENKYLKEDEEFAIGNMLISRYKMYPESEYFGTPQSKTICVVGTSMIIDSDWRYRVSPLYDLVLKMTEMMGAGNGIWKKDKLFVGDKGRNVVKYVKDCRFGEDKEISKGVIDLLWRSGLTYTQPKDRETNIWSAVQTVFDDHTSVLNNPTSGFAIAKVEKVHEDTWAEHTGTLDKTNAQFKQDVEITATNKLSGIFDGIFTVDCVCTITDYDAVLGYSYELTTHLYGFIAKTAQYSHVTMHRAEEV